MHLVHLALVTQQSAAIGEALQLLTTLYIALVRAVMLVHMLAIGVSVDVEAEYRLCDLPPLALAVECLPGTLFMFASHLAIHIPWWLLGTFVGMIPPG